MESERRTNIIGAELDDSRLSDILVRLANKG